MGTWVQSFSQEIGLKFFKNIGIFPKMGISL